MAETQTPESTPVKPASAGMNQNTAAALSYVLGFLSGIYFVVTEKSNKFVRFHAFQSIFFSVITFVLYVVLTWIPLIGWLIELGLFFVWLYLIWQAYQGVLFKLPVIGDMAEKEANKPVQ